MKKSLFNFYLDEEVKEQAQAKLLRLTGDKPKGQLAALIRILLKQFIMTPDEKINPLLIQAIDAEYEYSQKLNKRSNM
jgi:antitoxin component of RelBE/YafQ-DinJ toxin-antitoxin module